MSFFNWNREEQSPQKTYAIVYNSKNFGSFYVNKKGINVCCAMDSAVSCGKTWDNVLKSFNYLRTTFPDREFQIVEI